MAEHEHVTRKDTPGCRACDIREGRAPDPMRVPAQEEPAPVAPDLSAFPEAQHRIEDGEFVCSGDENARCHRYPGCDGEHEFWPCGCEYVAHAECWMKPWIDASYLRDSHADGVDGVDHISDAEFPDGDVEAWWEDEYVLWAYIETDPRPSDPSTKENDHA